MSSLNWKRIKNWVAPIHPPPPSRCSYDPLSAVLSTSSSGAAGVARGHRRMWAPLAVLLLNWIVRVCCCLSVVRGEGRSGRHTDRVFVCRCWEPFDRPNPSSNGSGHDPREKVASQSAHRDSLPCASTRKRFFGFFLFLLFFYYVVVTISLISFCIP